MKIIISIISLLVTLSAFPVTVEIKNLCEDSSYFSQDLERFTNTSSVHLSVYTFNQEKIPFIGNENGITGLLGTPQGLDAYEVIADDHMRVYGWCYSVDGSRPSVLASEYPIEPNSDFKLTWFYAYAELIGDKWISYCTPVFMNPNSFVCGQK